MLGVYAGGRVAWRGDHLFFAIAFVAAGQLGLYLLYGQETFLYAAHYGPVFTLLSAFVGRTQFRTIATCLAVMLLFNQIAHNSAEFNWSRQFLNHSVVNNQLVILHDVNHN